VTLEAFGRRARRAALRIAGDGHVIACRPALANAALTAAVARRRRGEHFVATIVWEDERARSTRAKSRAFCAQYQSWDEVRLMLNDAADKLDPRATQPLSDVDRDSLHEFIRLADVLLVRSIAERQRIEAALGPLPRETDVVVNDVALPPIDPAEPTDVVVYAPFHTGDELGIYVTALGDLPVPVTIVAQTPPRLPSALRFVGADEAGAALGRARVIVDATSDDPGIARSLAQLGRPLVVTSTDGAGELVRNVTTYEPWSRPSLLAAVAGALGGAAPIVRETQPPDRPAPRPAIDRVGAHAPLVSVIVTTYNRPVALGDALASIARQTYPAIEIIVVNDAGSDVRPIVAPHRNALLIDQPANGGPARARNAGLRAATGEYAIFFDDDDEMFPDHIGALVGAAERSGLDVAYGQMINGFTSSPPGTHYVVERVLAHVALLDNLEIQWGGSLATTAVLFRRRLIEQIGLVDETLAANEDYEYWIRLAAGRACARVSAVTSLYFVRTDGGNRSSSGNRTRYLDAHRAIFAKHPSDRPLVNAGRAAMLKMFSGNPA
jgi:GT2 family glycosyltransferase